MVVEAAERRAGPDRRMRRVSLRFPERRSGFDRREVTGGGVRRAYLRMLCRFRDRPGAVAAVAAGIVLANGADLVLTLRAIDLGATELNPVMAGLISASPVAAGAFKVAVASGVAVAFWALRRYRRVLETSLAVLAGMAVVLGYHAVAFLAAG